MKRTISLLLSICLISFSAYSQEPPSLIPPTNLQGVNPEQTDYIHLTWMAPFDSSTPDSIPEGLLGYNVYRDSVMIGYVDEPAEEYYDLDVPWQLLKYWVSAVYDLTYYGYPGETGESDWEGPVVIDLTGNICPLPFIENFTTGLFETNQWIADGSNWKIAGQTGNPAPSAEFSNMPPQTNYTYSLTSEDLRGTDFIAGQIFLDYDLKLDDNTATGQEKLLVEVYNGSVWTIISTVTANGDKDWELQHVDITDAAKGHLFKIRFTATGINSTDIINWQIDNIHVYRECAAPLDLQASQPSPGINYNVQLEWDAPNNPDPGPWVWMNWDDGVNYGAVQPVEFLIAAIRFTPEQLDYYAGGDLTTIRIFINDPATAISLKVWTGANAATLIVDQPVINYLPYQWNEFTLYSPVHITAFDEIWIGYSVLNQGLSGHSAGIDAGPALSGFGDMISFNGSTWQSMSQNMGIGSNWNIQGGVEFDKKRNHRVNTGWIGCMKNINTAAKRGIYGYNIFRDNQLIAATTETSYLDNDSILNQPGELFCYKVTALYDDCVSEFSNEDCVMVVPVNVEVIKPTSVEIYPNPAKDMVTIRVAPDIEEFRVFDILGNELVSHKVNQGRQSIPLNISNYTNGVYPVLFIKDSGKNLTKKFVVFH